MNPRHIWGREFAAPLNVLQEDLQRLFEHYRNGGATPTSATHAHGDPPAGREPGSAWLPPIDLYETAEEIGLLVDLPGVDPAAVDLTVSGRTLTLRGEKPRDPSDQALGRTLERPSGPFHRQVELPDDVDVDAIRAEAHNGVLSIRLPRVEAPRPQTIPIRVPSSSA